MENKMKKERKPKGINKQIRAIPITRSIIDTYISREHHLNFEKSEEGCHEWKSCKNSMGYGKVKINGTDWLAHRIELARKMLSDSEDVFDTKLVTRHLCDNPACINPEHLKLGTNQENMEDKKRKRKS